MTPCVHVHPSADRPRHSDEDMQPGIPGFGCSTRGQGSRKSRSDGPSVSLTSDSVQAFAEPHDQRVESFIRQQDIGAQAESEPRYPGVMGQPECCADILGHGWQ